MSDLEARLRDFERRLAAADPDATTCVRLMAEADDPDLQYLYAERLPRLGGRALPELLRLVGVTEAGRDLHYLAAWVGVGCGDRGTCVAALLEHVDLHTRWAVPAAHALARLGGPEAASAVLTVLTRLDPGDASVPALSGDLRELGGSLPTDLAARLITGAPPFVTQALLSDWSAG